MFGPTTKPTLSPSAPIIHPKQNVNLVLNVEGVTKDKKDEVCGAYANKINGTVTYCSFDPPPSHSRRLQSQTLYTQIEVTNDVKVDVSAIDTDIDVEGVTVTDVEIEVIIVSNIF